MPQGEQESWNMANATLQRFDFLLKQCSVFSQTGNLLRWKNCLMDLRRNLYPFMGNKEFDDITEKFNSLPQGWISPNGKSNPKTFSQVNQLFDEIYMVFIKVMKSKGLLMPKTIDSGKAVIEM